VTEDTATFADVLAGLIPSVSNVDLYVELDILPLSLFQLRVGQMLFKALNRNISPSIRYLFSSYIRDVNSDGMDLRTRELISIPLTRTERDRGRLVFYGGRLWNHLHTTFRDAHTDKWTALLRGGDCVSEYASLL
jgi:hypothetical protein